MSEVRRPTTRLGRKKDPRTDTLPPARAMSDSLLPRVEPLRKFPTEEARTGRSARLEELLAREKAERDSDADKMGALLARATEAELSAKNALATMKKLEARVAELEKENAALETQMAVFRRGGRPTMPERHDSVPTLATARSLATELGKVLDKIASRDKDRSDLPTPKSVRGGGG